MPIEHPNPSSGSDGGNSTKLTIISHIIERIDTETSPSDIETIYSDEEEQLWDIWDANTEAIAAAVSQFETQLVVTARTCAACQNVFDKWQLCMEEWPKSSTFPHHSNIHFLEASSKKGCRLCQLFLQSLESRNGLDKVIRRKALGVQTLSPPRNPLTMKMEPMLPGDPKTDPWNVVIIIPPTTSLEEIYGVVSGLVSRIPNQKKSQSSFTSEYTTSQRYDRAFLLAQRWLRDCLSSHQKCTDKNKNVVIVPTRLVFLEHGRIRLWQRPEKFRARLEYATLSHCWGKLDILKLRKANITRFEDEIPYADLCKTFQDAISIARQFQIKYLWIDSLCIIQDDHEDWERESSLMSEVYGGSHLNIAATSAKDGRDGCFFAPNKEYVFGHQVTATDRNGEEVFELVNLRLHEKVIFNEPLAKRAWAYQERVLAPRVLYFGKDQIFWECEEGDYCEDYPCGVPRAFDVFNRRAKPKSMISSWRQVILAYSGCELSFRRDKLVALSGVARNRPEARYDIYVAGLWKIGLESQLDWDLRDTIRATRRSADYHAPTWSWASVDGLVHPASRTVGDRLCTRVLEIQIQLRSLDPYGGVSGATLKLSCDYVVQATKVDSDWYLNVGENTTRWDCRYASWDYLEIPSTVFLLPTTEVQQPFERKSGDIIDPQIKGLILEPTGYAGQYTRAGTFHHRGGPDGSDSYNDVRKAMTISKAYSKEWSCDKQRSEDNFVIELV